ncbi:MAG TPA: NAD kinase [Thauera aminoaromatica]|jgi:NAD+ kinase|uniref:NAD kinase n=3 Tax=Thauera TaxID=33057 RepID=N6YWH9_THASP|nr:MULTISPECIES: NAD kinase [Thauera]MDA0233477.1 NAD kinase [Pseudomonadota bacterium]OPZ06771.1 MAG: putative inorganic polyphosphate/ATP-NAD kinase [Alphaproteobacteria bacterium ADurb.BinA305]TMW76552.1 NAD kinase [Thauera sp. UPWRP]ACK54478.1 NAD(+) kinase [Thauera aminoaromatica]ENO86777.1 NAD(+)/NADH kinase family protein [Thauera aminoaromatica S2]
MSTPFRTLALIGKYQSPDVAESVLSIARFLRDRGLAVLIEQGTASSIGGAHDFPVASYEHIGASADLAVVIGGDGTMLHTARRLIEHGVPLVGVNLGRLGFLTDIARSSATERLAEILDGAFTAEDRFMLDVEVLRGGARVFHTLALNDVVVNKGELGRMIEFELSIDEEFVYTQRSDGMIVSTPTGSTAYALSANGPILHPSVGGIALVPLCPHALTARPITLPDSCRIDIVLLPPHDARVHFDGQTRFDLRAGDCVRMTRSSRSLRLLHPEGYSYFAMLRQKLHWSAAPRV